MKKLLVLVAVAALLVPVSIGCTGSSTKGTKPAGSAPAPAPAPKDKGK